VDVTFSRLEQGQHGELVDLVGQLLHREGAHKAEVFSRAFWDWQHEALPTREAHVYVALGGGRIVGYYHVPVYEVLIGDSVARAGVIQDVAMDPATRGMGLFRRLAEFAHADLPSRGVELIYTYPNALSIHTFLKYNGYDRLGTYHSYLWVLRPDVLLERRTGSRLLGRLARPLTSLVRLWPGGHDRALEVEEVDQVTDATAEVFLESYARHAVRLRRDATYLNWRFKERPGSAYRIFIARKGQQTIAAAVVKEDSILNCPALVLMDLVWRDGAEASARSLVGRIGREISEAMTPRPGLFFASGMNTFPAGFGRLGFLPIPNRFDPRPLHVLLKTLVPLPAHVRNPQRWALSLTDWDVF
jgi:GNAT superfamily N-acetyltransferase